jgi:hypothetical protein
MPEPRIASLMHLRLHNNGYTLVVAPAIANDDGRKNRIVACAAVKGSAISESATKANVLDAVMPSRLRVSCESDCSIKHSGNLLDSAPDNPVGELRSVAPGFARLDSW